MVELFRRALEHAGEAVLITDVNGTIVWVNPAFTAITGYSLEEVVGQNPRLLKSGHHSQKFYEHFWQTILSGHVWRGTFINRRKDGTVYYDERTVAPVLDAQGNITHFVSIGEDVTERRRVEDALRNRQRHLEARHRIVLAALEEADLDGRLDRVLVEVMDVLGVEMGSIYLVEGGRLILRAWRGISDEFRAHVQAFPADQVPAWLREPQVVHERLGEAGISPDFVKREGIQAWASVPLVLPTGEWLGTMMLASRRYETLADEDIQDLWAFGHHLSLVIWHARVHRQAEERLHRLTILREIDRAIVQSLDIREILQTVLENVPPDVGVGAAAISLLDETKTRFQVFVMRLPDGRTVEERVFDVAESLLYWFVIRQEPVIIYDLSRDPRVQTHWGVLRDNSFFSYMGIPLVVRGETIGVLHLFTTMPKVFSDEDVAFFRTLAGQASIAVANTQMFHEAKERLRSMEQTLAAQSRISVANPKASLDVALRELQRVAGVQRADFWGYDESTRTLRLRAYVGWDDERPEAREAASQVRVRLGEGLIGEVAQERRSCYIPDTDREPRWRDYGAGRSVRSVYLVPVGIHDRLLGVLVLTDSEPAAFPSLRREVIDDFVNHAVASMEIARLLAEVRCRADQMETLDRIVRAANRQLSRQDIVQETVQGLAHVFPDAALAVFSHDEASGVLRLEGVNEAARPIVEAVGLKVGASVALDRLRGLPNLWQGQVLQVDDLTEREESDCRVLAATGIRSVLAVPIVSETRLAGVLCVGRPAPRAFTEGDQSFLSALADHLAVVFRNAQLFADLERAYEDLRQAQALLVQQERLRALGQMASGIAHDVNNALVPIIGYAEMLERSGDAQVQGYVRRFLDAARDIVHIMERLRAFYRPRPPEEVLETVDLNACVRQVVELTRPRWYDLPQREGVTIQMEMDLDEALPPIAGIGAEVREALTNLIFNAVDAVLEKGVPHGSIVLRTRRQGEWAVVEVSDSGTGMDEETKRRALEPFFTKKGERGSGLGLAIVYGIMQRHGGDIELESELGRGTTVRLVFPIRAIELRESGQEQVGTTAPLRILLIDDDPRVQQSLGAMLRDMGHRVDVADGGVQGLMLFARAQTQGEPYQLVLTDLGMPNLNGAEVSRRLKELSPTTPVVVLTGWGAEAKPPYADDALGKPVTWRALRSLLTRWSPPPTTHRSDTRPAGD